MDKLETQYYHDCVWFNKAQRAAGKALELSKKTADSYFVCIDDKTNMFGVGRGDKEPRWMKDCEDITYWITVHALKN